MSALNTLSTKTKNSAFLNGSNIITTSAIPDELEELEEVTVGTDSLENNLIKTNRLLNHQVVALKNKQQELSFLQQQLNKQLEEKNETIEGLNFQVNKFLNDDFQTGDKKETINGIRKDDIDNQSVRSYLSSSMYSIKSLMNNDNESISSHQSTNTGNTSIDPNKMINILISQRDVLKQKLKASENQNLEQNKTLDAVQLENYNLKQRLDYSGKQSNRQIGRMSQGDAHKMSTIDLEGQIHGEESDHGDYFINSRKYSAFSLKKSKYNLHNFFEQRILNNSFRKSLVINYFIALHLVILLTIIFHPLATGSKAQAVDTTSIATINSANLPPSGGEVMHAPGKGNAEQAAKDPLL